MALGRDGKTAKRRRETIAICIGGMAGSGKSTLAKKIAEKYHIKYFSGGDALMALAVEDGYQPMTHGWWESREGLRFLERRRNNPRFDEIVDKKLLEKASEGDVVLDSWTMPWLLKNGFKIWLEASTEKRAKRIAKRDKMSCAEALKALVRKEEYTKKIYKKMYGFSLGEDFEPFDFILDTETLNAREVFRILCKVINNMLFSSRRSRTLSRTSRARSEPLSRIKT